MFPYNDPQAQLDLYHQRTAQMVREAAEFRRARATTHGRRRFGRWPRRGRNGGSAVSE